MSAETDTSKKGFKFTKQDRENIRLAMLDYSVKTENMADHPKWDKKADLEAIQRVIDHFTE